MSSACLVDMTACIGCRACQVACKSWNELPAESTCQSGHDGGYQNPLTLGPKTYTVVGFHELEDAAAPGGLRWIFSKRQCMHCVEPACAAACPATALEKQPSGPVTYDEAKCVGCRYCVLACPFDVPAAEWNTTTPRIRKCDFCAARLEGASVPDGLPAEGATWAARRRLPACVATCPTDALTFGPREELLAEAWRRIRARPGSYARHVYGEHEAGGTSWLYLSAVPFERLGFPTDLGNRPVPRDARRALEIVPAAVVGLGALLGGMAWIVARREARAAEAHPAEVGDERDGS